MTVHLHIIEEHALLPVTKEIERPEYVSEHMVTEIQTKVLPSQAFVSCLSSQLLRREDDLHLAWLQRYSTSPRHEKDKRYHEPDAMADRPEICQVSVGDA
jgi:hypothetical protein